MAFGRELARGRLLGGREQRTTDKWREYAFRQFSECTVSVGTEGYAFRLSNSIERQSTTEEVGKCRIFNSADYLAAIGHELRSYFRQVNGAEVVDVLNRVIE